VSDIIGNGVAFPLRIDQRGELALSSGDEDVREAIRLILGTAPGERAMRPEFGCGIHDYTFESIDAHTLGRIEQEVRDALDRWEPRIDVLEIDPDLSRAADGVLLLEITYRLRSMNDVRNLIYPFYVIPVEPE
jgi:phage baseplate assembly protein W